MAGYVYGVGAEGVVVLVLSEIGDDEVEMGVRCCLRARERMVPVTEKGPVWERII